MWDQLLNKPATRAYLMQFPPSTWEEKTIEAIERAVDIRAIAAAKHRSKPSSSTTTSHRPRHSRRAQHSKSATTKLSGPAEAQPVAAPAPATVAEASPALRPATAPAAAAAAVLPPPPSYASRVPPRPVTWADEYYSSRPFTTTSSEIGAWYDDRPTSSTAAVQQRALTANARNASSPNMLHHHEHGGGVGGGLLERQKGRQFGRGTSTAGQDHTVVVRSSRRDTDDVRESDGNGARDEAVQVHNGGDQRGSTAAAVEATGTDGTGRWRYRTDKGDDIIINVTCQHTPQQSAAQPQQPPEHPPAPTGGRPSPPQPPPRRAASPAPVTGGASSEVGRSGRYYSGESGVRPGLHPSYLHPHPVYPSWWPSEEERLKQEQDERRKQDDARERERRRAERRQADNAKVRPVMDHSCPPPPASGREGVQQRREQRNERERKRLQQQHDEPPLLKADEDDVDILDTHLASSSSRPPLLAAAPYRTPAAVPSRIKPLLDRDRQERLGARWPAMGAAAPASASDRAAAAGGVSFATMLRELAADPIVSSFSSAVKPVPVAAAVLGSNGASAVSRAERLADEASVSTAAAVSALDAMENKGERSEDVQAGRRQWEVLKAKQVAKAWQMEDDSDDDDNHKDQHKPSTSHLTHHQHHPSSRK